MIANDAGVEAATLEAGNGNGLNDRFDAHDSFASVGDENGDVGAIGFGNISMQAVIPPRRKIPAGSMLVVKHCNLLSYAPAGSAMVPAFYHQGNHLR